MCKRFLFARQKKANYGTHAKTFSLPAFEFNWLIEQNGQIFLLKSETSDTLQKTITVCPSDFDIPGSHGDLHFRVNFLQDKFCRCGD